MALILIFPSASKKPFEVIYNRKKTITKSNNIEYFVYQDFTTKLVKDHVLNVFARVNPGEEYHKMRIAGKIVNKSFAIEGLPVKSEEGCGKDGLVDMHTVICEGKIKLVGAN